MPNKIKKIATVSNLLIYFMHSKTVIINGYNK